MKFTHILPAAIWSALIPVQLHPTIRSKYRRAHRYVKKRRGEWKGQRNLSCVLCAVCTLYGVYCAVCIVRCVLCTVRCVRCVRCVMCTVHCALCMLCTVYCVLCMLCTVYAVYVVYAVCTVCCVLCTVCGVRCARTTRCVLCASVFCVLYLNRTNTRQPSLLYRYSGYVFFGCAALMMWGLAIIDARKLSFIHFDFPSLLKRQV